MIIGIIGAMDEEIEFLVKEVSVIEIHHHIAFDIFEGVYLNKKIYFMKSGIGKVNAAIATQVLIEQYHSDVIVNTGIAGSLDKEVLLGDVVISTETQQYDFDVTAFGYEEGVIPRMESSVFPSSYQMIEVLKKIRLNEHTIHFGKILSGDRFVDSESLKKKLQIQFNGLCVDMESASVGQVCYLFQKPYVAIRCISDNADESSNLKYKDFNHYAAKLSAELTLELVNKI
ncbi:MAG: 5'-methylthioadenosine/adenosylhomocysteine nucleosidase [Tissierellales bacterium]|nr:5'-methylthioadenosine/adenosylhomocysteine nucleosidase [Tissierellales bacterium]MBN2827680.1 5'-methylthioadenosine/adenosylhomocysteine nucleosidase [Tissierellales bacterium]